jgi:hypothetical protein
MGPYCEFCDFENCPLYRECIGAALRLEQQTAIVFVQHQTGR